SPLAARRSPVPARRSLLALQRDAARWWSPSHWIANPGDDRGRELFATPASRCRRVEQTVRDDDVADPHDVERPQLSEEYVLALRVRLEWIEHRSRRGPADSVPTRQGLVEIRQRRGSLPRARWRLERASQGALEIHLSQP